MSNNGSNAKEIYGYSDGNIEIPLDQQNHNTIKEEKVQSSYNSSLNTPLV
jgi:hypothetical protein